MEVPFRPMKEDYERLSRLNQEQDLTELNRQGTTVLMVTHSQAHAEYARRDIGLFDGEIISEQRRRSL